jgi:hypothetical protein
MGGSSVDSVPGQPGPTDTWLWPVIELYSTVRVVAIWTSGQSVYDTTASAVRILATGRNKFQTSTTNNRHTFTPLFSIASISCDYCHDSYTSFPTSGEHAAYRVRFPLLIVLQRITKHTLVPIRSSRREAFTVLASHAVSTLLLNTLRLTISTEAICVAHTQSQKRPDTSALTSPTASVAPDCLQATNIDHAPHLLATCIHADRQIYHVALARHSVSP